MPPKVKAAHPTRVKTRSKTMVYYTLADLETIEVQKRIPPSIQETNNFLQYLKEAPDTELLENIAIPTQYDRILFSQTLERGKETGIESWADDPAQALRCSLIKYCRNYLLPLSEAHHSPQKALLIAGCDHDTNNFGKCTTATTPDRKSAKSPVVEVPFVSPTKKGDHDSIETSSTNSTSFHECRSTQSPMIRSTTPYYDASEYENFDEKSIEVTMSPQRSPRTQKSSCITNTNLGMNRLRTPDGRFSTKSPQPSPRRSPRLKQVTKKMKRYRRAIVKSKKNVRSKGLRRLRSSSSLRRSPTNVERLSFDNHGKMIKIVTTRV